MRLTLANRPPCHPCVPREHLMSSSHAKAYQSFNVQKWIWAPLHSGGVSLNLFALPCRSKPSPAHALPPSAPFLLVALQPSFHLWPTSFYDCKPCHSVKSSLQSVESSACSGAASATLRWRSCSSVLPFVCFNIPSTLQLASCCYLIYHSCPNLFFACFFTPDPSSVCCLACDLPSPCCLVPDPVSIVLNLVIGLYSRAPTSWCVL